MTTVSPHSALGVLHERAYAQLLATWKHTDVTEYSMRLKDGAWQVVADVYHDCDRLPSYTTHDLVMADLDEHVAARLLQDLQKKD